MNPWQEEDKCFAKFSFQKDSKERQKAKEFGKMDRIQDNK